MSDLEAKMAAALEGCFFWERTSYYEGTTNENMAEIRAAQRKHFVPKRKKEASIEGAEKLESGDLDRKDIPEIIDMVRRSICLLYGIRPEDLASNATRRDFATPKLHFHWALKRYMPWLSLAEIGRRIDRHHTTIIHGIRAFEKISDRNREKVQALDTIMSFDPEKRGNTIKA